MSDEQPMVFGSITSVNKYKRSKGMKVEPQKEHHEKPVAVSGPDSVAYVIGGDTNEEVTVEQAELDLLNVIKLRNDPDVVYMQEDFSFYDEFYLTDMKIDDALLGEAKKIRRIYRDYTKYMYACYIRDLYLKRLDEMYEVDNILKHTNQKCIAVPRDIFVPPYPIYSKNAADYNEVMSGNYMMKQLETEPPTDEELERCIDSLLSMMDRDPEKITAVPGGIQTYRPALFLYDNDGNGIKHSSKWSGPSSVSVTDLDQLQKMVRSWYKKEDLKMEKARERIPFPQSEEGIKTWYANHMAYVVEDYMEKEQQGLDENEMVYDEVSKKPMTRKEYQRRQTLRMLSERCGWDMVKLMSQLNVGSRMERKILRNKQKSRKKALRKATNFVNSITGTADVDYDYENPAAMSGDELRAYLFGD